MWVIWALARRNMRLYYRNRMSVFFSLLSVLIILALFVLFLGKMQIEAMVNLVGDKEGVDTLVVSWLIAGIIVVNATSMPMVLLSRMITDIERKMFRDFLASPIEREQIIWAYICAATMVGVGSTSLIYAIGQAYLVYLGAAIPSLGDLLVLFILLVFTVLVSASILFGGVVLIKTESTVGAVNSIIGTLIGFIAGIYLPMGSLSDFMQTVTKIFPHTHLTALLRQLLVDGSASKLFYHADPQQLLSYRQNYGIDLYVGDSILSTGGSLGYCVLVASLFIGISVYVLKQRKEQ